jgi:hypothetical protein
MVSHNVKMHLNLDLNMKRISEAARNVLSQQFRMPWVSETTLYSKRQAGWQQVQDF